MHDCCNPETTLCNEHVNTFIDLNGIPYLHAEYIDKRTIRQIDRAVVRDELTVDQSEPMRTVVDVSVNTIGYRASDGNPAVWGNNTKQKRLLNLVRERASQLDHVLDVIRPGIIMEVHYRLEDASTGHVLCSNIDSFKIHSRNYYMDINPMDVNDNAIITSMADTLVTSVHEFIHGHRKINVRITHIQMYYEVMARQPKTPSRPHAMTRQPTQMLPTCFGTELEYYQYHQTMQGEYMMGVPCNGSRDDFGFGCDPITAITPPSWYNYNRFYHFDNNGLNIVLHESEIKDPRSQTIKIPCGSIRVQRVFPVNPGHRIVYRFSVWTNDVTIVRNTMAIAKAIQAPMYDVGSCDCHKTNDNVGCCEDTDYASSSDVMCGCNPSYNPDQTQMLRMIGQALETNNKQSYAINQLNSQMNRIEELLDNLSTGSGSSGCGCNNCKPTTPSRDKQKAMVGGKIFTSLQDAIDAVQSRDVRGEISLMGDIEEELLIRGDISINLNGHTVSAPKCLDGVKNHHTFVVDGGYLVINGDGLVTNENYNSCCILNAGDNDGMMPEGIATTGMGIGTVTINGGKYIHNGDGADRGGIAILNNGAKMTIHSLTQFGVKYNGSMVICNGGTIGASTTGCPIMIIKGGKYNGGIDTLFNATGAKMLVEGGVFEMGTKWPPDSTGGPRSVIFNNHKAILQIKNGKFVGDVDFFPDDTSVQIFGGKFTVSIEEFVADGYTQRDDGYVVKKDEPTSGNGDSGTVSGTEPEVPDEGKTE